MKNRLALLLCLFALFLLCSFATASTPCTNHEYILCTGAQYDPVQIGVSDSGHHYRYYTYWFCVNGNHTDYLPANDPFMPDYTVPHDYSMSRNHRLTVDLKHAQDLYCSTSGCTYHTTTTHSSTAHLTNQGHTLEDKHWYDYICPDCSRTFYIERNCTDTCPLQAYRIKPKEEDQ